MASSSASSSPLDRSKITDVSGLVAVVTGGGTGLGATFAKTLEANGAKVYITGRRLERLEVTAKEALHPGNIIPIQGSTTSKEDLQRAVDHITQETGYIDLLVNNAGMTTFDDSRPMPTAQSSVSEVRDYFFNYRSATVWRDALETNVAAVFTTSMAFLELLDAGNKRRDPSLPTSQIITIGSTGGLTRHTHSFIYNASKAGVHHLMKNLGSYFVPFDVRTNVIAPGCKSLQSSSSCYHCSSRLMISAGFPSDMSANVAKQFEGSNGVMPRELVPQQRMGNEDELAGTILYLASKAGGYCNGNVMVIDGGFLANHAGTY
jgi:NAD(P)-dependent dehydrogenase (short-subunit alcohol dehydrogenase family)